MKSFKLLPIFALISFSAHAGEYAAKALFFGEDESVVSVPANQPKTAKKLDTSAKKISKQEIKPKQENYVAGASYYILVNNKDGTSSRALANRTFYSGDRFKLAVKVKNQSYVYIVNEEENGKATLLYPQKGYNNFVRKMGEVVFPAKGFFEFDNQPGNEKLMVYVTPEPIQGDVIAKIIKTEPDVVQYSKDQVAEMCSPTEDQKLSYASKGINLSDVAPCTTTGAEVIASSAYASKGISFAEDDSSNGTQNPASYVIKNNPNDKNLSMKINLSHK